MSRTDRLRRTFLIPVVAMLLAIAPACNATAGHRYPKGQYVAADPSGRVAYRPIYNELLRPKTLYLTGYAGATYAPVLNPTGFRARTGQPRGHLFGWPWSNH
jgi:hypothetical protein